MRGIFSQQVSPKVSTLIPLPQPHAAAGRRSRRWRAEKAAGKQAAVSGRSDRSVSV